MTIFHAIALLTGVSIFCLLVGLFWAVRGRRRQQVEALRRRLQVGGVKEEEREVDPVRRAVPGELDGVLGELAVMRRLSLYLLQGGVETPLRRVLVQYFSVVLGVFLLIWTITGSPMSGIVLAIVTVLGIYFVLNSRRDRRLSAVDEQLPKALELMMIGLRAGHTLEDTIRFAATELQPPLGSELRRCHDEYQLGRPIEQALTNLSMRLAPCKALRTFVESVLVLKQSGGNLIEIIEQIIDSLRAQAAYEARFRALTAEGRTSGLILGSLPLLVLAMVLLLQPGYLGTLVTVEGGFMVLSLSLGLWLTGIIWLFKLVKPQI